VNRDSGKNYFILEGTTGSCESGTPKNVIQFNEYESRVNSRKSKKKYFREQFTAPVFEP
jgi:hypothetical protein